MRSIPWWVKVIAIVCNQFGDSGKGKIVDYYTNYWRPKYVVRPCGADNAGHTIEYEGRKIITHIIPSGIIHDKDGIKTIVGRNAAVNLITGSKELASLGDMGISHNGLAFSVNAKLILPQHILLDRLRESSGGGIGTTGRGVGPVYADHVARIGLTIGDLENKDVFVEKLKKNLKEKSIIFKKYETEVVEKIMFSDVLCNGLFYDENDIIDIDSIIDYYENLFRSVYRDIVRDTEKELRKIVGKEKILLEGAQGMLLDIDDGTYPFVTSSNCSPAGLAHGAGLRESDVDLAIGIVKAPYMTRVGNGPFPTEIGGLNAVSEYKKRLEKNPMSFEDIKERKDALLNSNDEITQAGTIGVVGNEFGATTGRPRRVGWLDLVALKYAVTFSKPKKARPKIIITKPDVLSGCDTIPICVSYIYNGEDCIYEGNIIRNGDVIKEMIIRTEIFEKCIPVYAFFKGWKQNIENIKKYSKLPKELKEILKFIEKEAGVKIMMVSVGPDRDQTIIC